jgi:hydroxypyruvate reductase
MTDAEAHHVLEDWMRLAIANADPARCLPPHLPSPPAGRTVVVGAGKAAAAMAAAVERHWPNDAPLSGLVVTRYGHGMPTTRIRVVEAAHPVPDAAGLAAAAEISQLARGLSADDLLLVLLSGGGSALLAAPAPWVELADKRELTQQLLRCGATISEINCVRKHLSALKGGRLAQAAAPARVLTLAISDVPGDDLSVIASGPTVADPSTCVDALDICARYAITLPPSTRNALENGVAESPKPGDPCFDKTQANVIATPQSALAAVAAAAKSVGVAPLILGDRIEGEAREVARVFAGIAASCRSHGTPLPPPCVLLSGGETTVTLSGSGRGGRNSEFLLSLALALDGAPGIYALAIDTDGIDGSEDNAGARIAPDTLARAGGAAIARRALDAHDAYGFFAGLDDLILTGPTRTNINDFRAILVL